MKTADAQAESFETGMTRISATDLSGRSWMYLKKLHEKKEGEFQQERNSLLESIARANRDQQALAIEFGKLAHELLKALERQKRRNGELEELSYLKGKMESALKTLGIEVEDPQGKPIEGALMDRCDVIYNTPQPGLEGHIVGETLVPTIIFQGKVIRLAEVIGWVGVEQASDQAGSERAEA